MSWSLEELILEDAERIRKIYKANPDPDAESDTEESVIAALIRAGMPPIEVLRRRDRFVKAFRKMLAGGVD